MPAVMQYVRMGQPGWKEQELAHSTEMKDRAQKINEAWKYYDAEFDPLLKPDGTKTDDNLAIPLVTIVKDQEVSAMQGTDEEGVIEGVQFEVSEDEAGAKEAQEHLDLILEANEKDLLLHNIFLSGGVTGHNIIKIEPNRQSDPNGGDPLPRLVVVDGRNFSAFWREDDKDVVVAYRIEYGKAPHRRRQDIVQSLTEMPDGSVEEGGSWTILTYKEEGQDTTSGETKWSTPAEVTWDYPFPPIVDWQDLPDPRGYYGKSDTRILGRLNQAVNFTEGNKQRIIKNHAHPNTILLGASAEQIQPTAVDRLWAIPVSKTEAEVKNLEMQSDLSSSADHAMNLRRSLFDAGRELDPSTVEDKLGDLTNFALRVLYKSSLNKRHTKWLNAGSGLKRLCQYLLVLKNFKPNMKVNVIPPNPLPQNPTEQAQTLGMDVQHGVSRQTYLEKRGYDPDTEKERRDEERDDRLAEAEAMARAQGFANTAQVGRRAKREQDNERPAEQAATGTVIAGRPAGPNPAGIG